MTECFHKTTVFSETVPMWCSALFQPLRVGVFVADVGVAYLPDGRRAVVRKHTLDRLRKHFDGRIRNPLRLVRSCVAYAERVTLSSRQRARQTARHGADSEHWVDKKTQLRFIVVRDGRHDRYVIVTVYRQHPKRGRRM